MSEEISVDDVGIRFGPSCRGAYEVRFDDEPVWTVEAPAAPDAALTPWPPTLRPWLHGVSRLSLRRGEQVVDLGEVVFGDGTERIRFVDENGVRIVLDKWGIRQRPFEGRDRSVVEAMVGTARTIIDVVEREVGVRLWMAFGTLLGAAREGGVIAHDADIDLAYLSDQPTPAAMTRELYAIRRALVRHGLRVINKTGSFITVAFTAPDGSLASIDVYTCFYVGDHLYETATVRARVPREAIEPLQELPFEGARLPAPADPDRLLTASYGPGWRTPDPSFRHRPGTEVTRRFDGWFGSVMRQRREWEVYWRDTAPTRERGPTSFAHWVAEQLPPQAQVVELGSGDGQDALSFARRGWPVTALDYARSAAHEAARTADSEGLPLQFGSTNLYDTRDALTMAALLRRTTAAPRVLYARSLVDAVAPDARESLWRFAQLLLRGGGRGFLEFDEVPRPAPRARFHGSAGRQFPVHPDEVCRRLREFGGVVVQRSQFRADAGDPAGTGDAADPGDGEPRGVRRWRVVVEWRS